MKGINPPTDAFAWPTLDCNPANVVTFTELTDDVRYKLGAKNPLDRPLKDLRLMDCSDWIRRLVYQISELVIPDGSWNQGELFKKQGFKVSTMDACKLKDGALRVVVRKQKTKGKGVTRHIWVCYMGMAFHCSSSNKGVAQTRLLPSTGRETVYVLTAPVK